MITVFSLHPYRPVSRYRGTCQLTNIFRPRQRRNLSIFEVQRKFCWCHQIRSNDDFWYTIRRIPHAILH